VDISQIRTLLNWMQSIELGQGDLCTELITPYALHSSGSVIARSNGIFVSREVLELLFEESGKQLTLDWQARDGDPIHDGEVLFGFNGNGADILKNRRLIHWIVGRMSGLATATKQAATVLDQHGKTLVQGISVNPIFELLDEIAFQIGGGIWKRRGLTDSIYITQNHLRYSGGTEKTMEQIVRELGDTRRSLKIEVEINTVAEFEKFNELDCDILHLVGLSEADIRSVFESLNPIKKPVLHLNRLADFRAQYADYFFKYCAIEELHCNIEPLNLQIIFNPV